MRRRGTIGGGSALYGDVAMEQEEKILGFDISCAFEDIDDAVEDDESIF